LDADFSVDLDSVPAFQPFYNYIRGAEWKRWQNSKNFSKKVSIAFNHLHRRLFLPYLWLKDNRLSLSFYFSAVAKKSNTCTSIAISRPLPTGRDRERLPAANA
jgi:hypothetical protein